jgi:hypothetical protein
MKNVNSFEEFINEGKDELTREELLRDSNIQELMDKFDISEEEAARVDEIVDEILSLDDLDDRMDYVEGLTLEFDIEDEDKCEEVMEYLKDICIG